MFDLKYELSFSWKDLSIYCYSYFVVEKLSCDCIDFVLLKRCSDCLMLSFWNNKWFIEEKFRDVENFSYWNSERKWMWNCGYWDFVNYIKWFDWNDLRNFVYLKRRKRKMLLCRSRIWIYGRRFEIKIFGFNLIDYFLFVIKINVY